LREFWAENTMEKQTEVRGLLFEESLSELAERHAEHVAAWRGRGLVWGLAFQEPRAARQVADAAFARGLLVETAGSEDEVVKLMPPLTATDEELAEGLGILRDSVAATVGG
jgi:diaminobutyrate-2-oxoglutarate transaminase